MRKTLASIASRHHIVHLKARVNMSSAKVNQKGKRKKDKIEEKGDIEASPSKIVKNPENFNDSTKVTADITVTSTKTSTNRLQFPYFDTECTELAKSLLGQTLVSVADGKRLAGKIVETEAYVGAEDKACHSYKGKRTPRNEAMYMPPGTAYVYNIYGMYCCINISSKGDGAAVLIRALEPLENLEIMDKNRTGDSGKSLLKKDGKDLCNGPSKLCRALAITKSNGDQVDMCTSDNIWLEKGETVEEKEIVKSKRINISYGEEWVDKLLRFYVLGSKFVSVRDKEAEKLMENS